MAEEVPRTMKNQALKRLSSDVENQDSLEQNKRGKGSFLKPPDSSLWLCKSPACRATQSTGPRFCKRCSCCICRQFDNNMDPSLWLKCTPDSGSEASCGFSCHVECALQHGKVGARALQVQLDGCYSCASCGKVSSIIGCWKKQLKIAMDTNSVDVLCYRIFLSYRLLNGTSRFSELHKFIEDLKAALEVELGPISEALAKMSHADAGRLHAASHVQALCKLAIKKAEELLTSNPSPVLNLNVAEGSVPSSERQCKSRADSKSDSRLKVIQKTPRGVILALGVQTRLQEPCSRAGTEKSIGVGDVQPEALQQERLSLPDLNEEFREPDAEPNTASPVKSNDSGGSDDDFENIVRTICGLEHGGHVSKEFRLKFLTWFSLKAREHVRRVAQTFVKTMADDPSGLAAQLVDTFSGIVFSSRP